jgi:glutaminase
LATQSRILAEHGQATRVYELQGDLRFATLEPVLRDIVDAGAPTAGGPGSSVVPTPLRHAVLDFARVTHVDAAALGLLERLADTCAARGQHLVLTRVRRGELMGAFGQGMDPRSARAVSFQPQLDFGLEWCERQLLAEHGVAPSPLATGPAPAVDLAAHSLCDRLDPADLRWLDSQLDTLQAEAGTLIVAKGDAADRLYFLMAGEVSVVVGMPQGETRRLTTLGPGIGFGESALLDGGLRSADVRADTHVVCRTLTVEAFERLREERPRLALGLMHNLLRLSAATAARLTGEVAALGASVH